MGKIVKLPDSSKPVLPEPRCPRCGKTNPPIHQRVITRNETADEVWTLMEYYCVNKTKDGCGYIFNIQWIVEKKKPQTSLILKPN
jgi:hypothetical protein